MSSLNVDIIDVKEDFTFDRVINNVICGDCLEVMKKLPDECIDVIVTSPPYNVSGNREKKGEGKKVYEGGAYDGYDDNMDYNEYCVWQNKCLKEMFRIIKKTGGIFYNHKQVRRNKVLLDKTKIFEGIPIRQIITWYKGSGIDFHDGWFYPVKEDIYLICKPDYEVKRKYNTLSDVWRIHTNSINKYEDNEHPAPFPIELPLYAIKGSAYNQVVLDPFGGSGTTALAARRLGKQFIMIDRSREYAEMMKNKIEKDVFSN